MYQQEYEQKRITVDQLLELFRSGSFVVFGSGPNAPDGILKRLHELKGRVSGIRASIGLVLAPYPVMTDAQYAGILEQESMFYSPIQRISDRLGGCSYLPTHLRSYHDVAMRAREDPDMLVTSVAPMDAHGYFSVCAGNLIEQAAIKRAKRVVVEVCSGAPRTFGDSSIHISQVDAIVESCRGLPILPPETPTEVDMAIGRHVAGLVEDGATIQLGIGSIPNAVARSLMGKRDLGMHTEMLVDSTVDLVEQGVLNGRCKTLHPGKIVTVFTLGTQRLYDFINDNPGVLHLSASYTNDPYVIAQNYKMTSINTTLQVDLFGQCASEAMTGSQISGVGGQAETAMGAQMSPGGKAIMTLPSTALIKGKDGGAQRVSKIVPALEPGTIVSTPRSDVEYVVTEFGVAELKGKTVRERARALIGIAHPDFQAQLSEAAQQMHLL